MKKLWILVFWVIINLPLTLNAQQAIPKGGNNYYYEPSVSVVTGLLTTKTVDTTELQGRGLQNIFVLNTTNPINVIWTGGNNYFGEETVNNISTIQLTGTYDFSAYKGKQVRLTGKFFYWYTGHHYTKVLMFVDKIEV
jgi:hypothetical protein